ncbi:MAG TPA: nitric-oxide reductase large subunit [Vicinamibacterales bacterium]|nr:nitric-oxide reductase large subunit [Vicinamibacterales bacterium]
MSFRKLWIAFGLVVVSSFAVLAWMGVRIYQEAPPIPERVVTSAGQQLIGPGEISDGQNVWQSMGGMEVGSIWGHGSYVAPDWTADWLHREATFILDTWSGGRGAYATLAADRQAELQSRLQQLLRTNTYRDGTITVDAVRAEAFAANLVHYADVFSNGRDEYAIPAGTLTDREKLRKLAAFFFWTSWAASTSRPNADVTYTSNWPHEPLVGNRPTADTVVWTGVSIIMLLAGIGAMASYHASIREHAPADTPGDDPLLQSVATPSQRATVKYFWVVAALLLVQILLGVITAHYGVEGTAFYGIPLAGWLPYSLSRTWHVQLGIFWIATAWLATGLYIGPAVGGREPAWQRFGVNVLFGALLVVVVGSLAGQWLSVKQILGTGLAWFYLGHSGYEYIDLGRLWQIALLAGLFLWLALMVRAIGPALRERTEQRPLLILFLLSIVAIAAFYTAALGYGRRSNLATVEYWRWWVVHLWVEGFFEVFATVVIAFLFSRLKLVTTRTAAEASVLSATIFLSGGIIGTAHHLYFSGTPTLVLALGSVFSALEVVPLLFVGFEAWENIRLSQAREWVRKYRWPIYFFVSVAFWNLVGAGLFGFMINPPIALYYMQGLNTTPVHGHAALFGVYGMLGIGLMLFSLRALDPIAEWKEGLVRVGFWATNIGLFLMVVLSLLPVGLMQTWASVEIGYWYARSPEFLQNGTIETFRWLRIIGDTIFAIGALAIAAFIIGLKAGWSTRRERFRIQTPAAATGR